MLRSLFFLGLCVACAPLPAGDSKPLETAQAFLAKHAETLDGSIRDSLAKMAPKAAVELGRLESELQSNESVEDRKRVSAAIADWRLVQANQKAKDLKWLGKLSPYVAEPGISRNPLNNLVKSLAQGSGSGEPISDLIKLRQLVYKRTHLSEANDFPSIIVGLKQGSVGQLPSVVFCEAIISDKEAAVRIDDTYLIIRLGNTDQLEEGAAVKIDDLFVVVGSRDVLGKEVFILQFIDKSNAVSQVKKW